MLSLTCLTWTTVKDLSGTVLVVPIGATEQHGPHLPLSTDSDIAEAIADRLAQARPDDVTVAPVIPFGSSGEHQSFAGTLSIGRAALEEFLVELGRSATCTWERVVFLSTHGGNREAVSQAVGRLQAEGRDVRAWKPTWGGDCHAGRSETSLMLAIDPKRVRASAAEAGATEPLAQLMPRLVRDGVEAVSANGVLGDPAGASPNEGQQLLAAASVSLSELITSWPPAEV